MELCNLQLKSVVGFHLDESQWGNLFGVPVTTCLRLQSFQLMTFYLSPNLVDAFRQLNNYVFQWFTWHARKILFTANYSIVQQIPSAAVNCTDSYRCCLVCTVFLSIEASQYRHSVQPGWSTVWWRWRGLLDGWGCANGNETESSCYALVTWTKLLEHL